MPLSQNFIGAGMPAEFSRLEGYNPPVAITAAGSNSGNATALSASQNFVLMTGTGTDGVRLSSGSAMVKAVYVANVSAAAGIVYPPTGGNFTGGTTDAGISVPSRKTLLAWRYSNTGWAYNLSA